MLFVDGDLERSSELTSPPKAQLSSQIDQATRAVSSSAVTLSKAGNTAGSWSTLSSAWALLQGSQKRLWAFGMVSKAIWSTGYFFLSPSSCGQWHWKKQMDQSINTHLCGWCCCQRACETSWDPTWSAATRHRKGAGWLEGGQSRVMMVIQGLEHLSCKDRLGELGFFLLEKRKLQRDFIAGF